MEKSIKQLTTALSSKNTSQIQKAYLKIILLYTTKNPTNTLKTQFWLKSFNSRDITKLLSLLEDKEKKVRKLTLIILCIFLQNEDSKLYFIEKCGLLAKKGKIFLTRLKYLKLNLGNLEKSIKVLNCILRKKNENFEKSYLFWFIPLKFSSNEKCYEEKIKYMIFEKNHITYTNRDINISQIPDPIYNLCGFEIFFLKERSKKIINFEKTQKSSKSITKKYKSKIDRSKSPMIRDLKSPSINRRVNEFSKNNKSKMNKKFFSKRRTKSPLMKKKVVFKKSNYFSIRHAKSSVRKVKEFDKKMYETVRNERSKVKNSFRKTITSGQYDRIFNKRSKTLYD